MSSNALPEIPGMVWLKMAIPVPEHYRGTWETIPAEDRWNLRATVRAAAEEALDRMLGVPMPVVGAAVQNELDGSAPS